MRTTEELRAYVREHSPDGEKDENTTDEALVWFVCMQEANTLLADCTTKDMARLLCAGMPAYGIEDVQTWLDTCHEEDEAIVAIEDAVREHFGWRD